MAKRHKKKRVYTISVTSDISGDRPKYYRSRINIFRVCIIITFLATAAGVLTAYLSYSHMNEMEATVKALKEIVSTQEQTVTKLENENAALISRNEILSITVGKQQVENEEQEEIKKERAIPNGFPLTDSGEIEEQDEETTSSEDYLPIVIFDMSDAADVVAAGDGIVSSVHEDSVYGNCVVIDHGNGYFTYYRNAAVPKVNEGEEITGGTIIYVGGLEDNKLGYQMTKDGEYIDPLELISISG